VTPIPSLGCDIPGSSRRQDDGVARIDQLLAGLVMVDTIGSIVAVRQRVAGEPLGIGASLDVRRPAVLIFWGTGHSAPLASLVLALVLRRVRPQGLRPLGALFAAGALSEPVFWGRRSCSLLGRLVLISHVVLGVGLAATPTPD
jgi:hypothetical protein